MRGHGSQWILNKINIRHLGKLKKWKSWAYFEANGLDWQCCLAGSFQRAPRIFIFSIVLGAECLLYLKSIETHARAFSRLISDGISGVRNDYSMPWEGLKLKFLRNLKSYLLEKSWQKTIAQECTVSILVVWVLVLVPQWISCRLWN